MVNGFGPEMAGLEVRTRDGVRLWAERFGSPSGADAAAPLLLLHGGPGLWDMSAEVAAMLAAEGRTVYRWDQRGCGRSQRDGAAAGPYSLDGAVADVADVLDGLAIERAVLIGHSWGADLALHFALTSPERVAGLVYLSGVGIERKEVWRDEFELNLHAALGSRADRWSALGDPVNRSPEEEQEHAILQWSAEFPDRHRALEHAEAMATPWFSINYRANRELGRENAELAGTDRLRAACAALRVSVLILDGELDIRPRHAVNSLERILPEAKRVVLPGSGHLPWVDEPDAFRSALSGFLVDR